MTQKIQKLRGFATIGLWAADHKAAVEWYSKLFGREPYFNKPGYAEFRVGDYEDEIGIVDSKYAPYMTFPKEPSGVIIYWHVDDVDATLEYLLSLGATLLESRVERGHGFVTAKVVDPFGNILGIMYNPHYVEVYAALKK